MQDVPSYDIDGFNKHYLTLTSLQQQFAQLIVDWIESPRKMMIMLSGGPGTGKTFVVNETLKYFNVKQLRMAFTARAAQAIHGQTIHSTLKLNWSPDSVYHHLEKILVDENDVNVCIAKSRDLLAQFSYNGYKPDIIVVDEISMINGWMMYWIIRYFMDQKDTRTLFIVMGDRNQLSPVKSIHNLFSVTNLTELYKVYPINLLQSKRFTPEYEIIINKLRTFVDEQNETDLYTFLEKNFPIVKNIDASLLKRANRAMAFKNITVNTYNNFYIQNMLPGKIIRLYSIKEGEIVKTKYIDIKPNCPIFINQNGMFLNGTQLIFLKYIAEKDELECINPENEEIVFVPRNAKGFFPIDVAFAGTVHKFQGQTIDFEKILINFDEHKNLNLVYTALSRVRDKSQILAVKF